MKKTFRVKSFVLLLTTVMLVSMLSACGGDNGGNNGGNASPANEAASSPASEAAESPASSEAKEPVELKMTVPNTWSEFEGITEIVRLYEEATGNKIKLEVFPEDQYYNVIKTGMSTNDAPDVIAVGFGQSKVPYSFLEPLDGPWIEQMLPSIRNIASKDGKVYEAYANPIGYLGVIYNKKVFEKAGVKVPLMNYQQLMDAVKAIQANGVTPIFMGGKENWTYEMIPALGGTYVLEKEAGLAEKMMANQTKPADEPRFAEMADRMLSLQPFMNKDHMSVDTNAGLAGIANGEYAMTFLGDWLFDAFKEVSPDHHEDVGIMPITLGDDYISAIGTFTGKAFGVPSSSKNKEAAKEFVNFVMQPENYKVVIKPFNGPSPYKNIEGDMNRWQQEMDAMISANGIPVTNSYLSEKSGVFNWGAAFQAFQDMFAGKTVKQAYEDWYKDYERLNRTEKTPGWE